MRDTQTKRAPETSAVMWATRRRPIVAPRIRPPAIRWVALVGIALGATQLGACVRYDSMRVFYGRDSVVLAPEGADGADSSQAIATVSDDGD